MAFNPRPSPDGQTLAFEAMVDGQTQVAIMKPQSGNWRVLTESRTRGLVVDLCWSRDGTRIFFDRFFDVPLGIFSVPALGGDERLVLDNAMSPQALPDGSLLIVRANAARQLQLHRYWPETDRLGPLPALPGTGATVSFIPYVRAFPDGREAVFFGRPSAADDSPDALYAIDLVSKSLRRLAPPTMFENNVWTPVAVTPDAQQVLFPRRVGSQFRILEAPRDGSGVFRPIVTLTSPPNFWPAAVLDPRTGAVTPMPKSVHDVDMFSPGWAADGRVVTVGWTTRSTMWRFRPAPRQTGSGIR